MRRLLTAILCLTAALELGCAQLSQLPPDFAGAPKTPSLAPEVRGPGAVFDSVEAAAVDALKFSYQQARASGDLRRMRAGTVRRSGAGYTYGEIQIAKPWSQRQVEYRVGERDVARFHFYPQHTDREVNRTSERLSTRDWRSVSVVDPLHRPLYVLHPSLAIRAYHFDGESVAVVNLSGPARPSQWPSVLANR